jgi:CRP-like cAMP-binding protein
MSIDNFLLASLTPESRKLIVSRSIPVVLPLREILYEANDTPEYAYFVTSGLASVVTSMLDGATAEISFIGREGLVGAFHLIGPAEVPTNCFMQMAGSALRIPITDLKEIFDTSEEVRERILETVQEQALTIGQISTCNRLHESQERLARWLLMARDRTQSDELNITQEFLAEMLGARRTTVTMVAGAMQRSGYIEYRRGKVRIILYDGLYKETPGIALKKAAW